MQKMKRLHKLFLILLILEGIVLAGATSSSAYEVNEMLILNGYLENQSGVRTEDHFLGYAEAGDMSLMINTAQLDVKGWFGDAISYKAKVRAWYDAVYDLDSSIDQRPADEDRHIHDVDLHTYYVTAEYGPLNVQLGQQELVWGETDLFRMADVINPIDLSWHYLWPALDGDGYRIPLRMAVVNYITDWNNFVAEAVWIPEHFRPTKIAAEGANYFPPAFLLPGGYNVANTLIDRAYEESDSDNSQYGLRLKATLGGADASVYYFHKKADLPALDFNTAMLALEAKFDAYDIVGATLNYYEAMTKTVFRLEATYNFKQPYTAFENHPLFGLVPNAVEKDTFAYMIGFDNESFLGWPKGRTVNISGQMFQQYIIDSDSSIFYPFMDEPTKAQTMFTLI
ncbi:MAG: DUF1302 family protein, partial [Desulfatitalea sp.]|nr:DUF1302 domain-containing protein [Desulfatitalea sp.]NNJ99094.1 DUF1302 family protein [Desulfatitalea sp.]